jgi:hypothetical protein
MVSMFTVRRLRRPYVAAYICNEEHVHVEIGSWN